MGGWELRSSSTQKSKASCNSFLLFDEMQFLLVKVQKTLQHINPDKQNYLAMKYGNLT
jgi:hypothetical protein